MQKYYGKRTAVYDESVEYDAPQSLWTSSSSDSSSEDTCTRSKRFGNSMRTDRTSEPVLWLCPPKRSWLLTTTNQHSRWRGASLLAGKRCPPSRWRIQPAWFPINFEVCMAVDWFACVPSSRFDVFLKRLHGKQSVRAIVVFCYQADLYPLMPEVRPTTNSLTFDFRRRFD